MKTTLRSIKGDVVMISGCKDSQYSYDAYNPGMGSSGMCSYALIKALGSDLQPPTYRDQLKNGSQVARISQPS